MDNVPIRMRVTYARHRIEFTTGDRIDVSKWNMEKQWVREIDRIFGSYFNEDKLYEELYKPYLKSHYAGKPTKRYLRII